MKKKYYPLFDANLTYFIFALLLIFVGSVVQAWDFKYGMLITEYGLVFAPVILLGLMRHVDMKKALRLNPIKWKYTFMIFGIVLLALPITMTLNLTVIAILSLFDKVLTLPIPTATSLQEFGVLFFIISISAGICEETFFRGMILNAYEGHYSKRTAIIVSAVFFGLFHFNIQNLFGPIFLGLLFGYLVIETNSLFAGILAHLINNGFAVVFMALANVFKSIGTEDIVAQQQADIFQNPKMLFAAVALYALISCLTGVGVYALFKALKREIERDKALLTSSDQEIIPENEDILVEPSKTKQVWYRQVHHLPVLGTCMLYVYYLIRHMSI